MLNFKTFSTIEQQLALNGSCFIATKRFYFGAGLGGGTEQLEQVVNAKNADTNSDPLWTIQTVQTFEDGFSNIRDILLLSRKKAL